MKVKTINRNEQDYTRERSQDLKKVHRNYDPSLHQFKVGAPQVTWTLPESCKRPIKTL